MVRWRVRQPPLRGAALLLAPSVKAAVTGLDPSPADLEPGQLGTVFEELLDGDVTHVQL